MFEVWDWAIVGIYILGTTLVGHNLKGKQKSTRDFFCLPLRFDGPDLMPLGIENIANRFHYARLLHAFYYENSPTINSWKQFR